MSEKPKVIVIVGPTASGKTSLSIEISKKFNGEIISADSRQVYKGLDIGSGKVTKEEMEGVPHHLLDVAGPNRMYTAADFVRDGRRAVADILSRGKLPIIAGGTFFYVDALLGKIQTPDVPPNLELRAVLEQQDTESLFAMLQEKDPRRAADIDLHNKRRLIRSLEIAEALGHVPHKEPEELYETFTIGVDIKKEALHDNIHNRLIERIEGGMLDEVRNLHKSGVLWERLEELGLEYRYIAQYLQEKMSREEMIEKLETEIRRFAKRQMTWLKRNTDIQWFKCEEKEKIYELITTFLKN